MEEQGSALPDHARDALDESLPHIYEQLRSLARIYLSKERVDHTFQPTALVHEAYVRLIGQRHVDWQNRAQFLGIAAQMMRRILLNYAKMRHTEKRGGEFHRISLDGTLDSLEARCDAGVFELDDALNRLAAIDARQAQIVEMRCFGGLSVEEVAEALEISETTVKRDWTVARLWLRRELGASQ